MNELIKKEIPRTEIKGDVVIIDSWGFELDRSVPKIGHDLGQADKLVFPTVTVSEAQLADNHRTATFTVKALEETNGINKIEIWLNGEKLDTYDNAYSNIKTEISEDFTVKRNGVYTIKVYGELMVSATAKVEGIVPAVKFSPNGNTEWKKEHSTTITVEQTGETVTEIKYLWKTGENEPQASEFTESCTNNSTITGKGLTGKYHLWILLKTDNDKTNICGSEEFYFDNQEPTAKVTATPVSKTSFKLTITAKDEVSELGKCDIYVNEELKEPGTFNNGNLEYLVNTESMGTDYKCKVTVYDVAGNYFTVEVNARTLMYTWKKYEVKRVFGYNVSSTQDFIWDMSSQNKVVDTNVSFTFDESSGRFSGSRSWSRLLDTKRSPNS